MISKKIIELCIAIKTLLVSKWRKNSLFFNFTNFQIKDRLSQWSRQMSVELAVAGLLFNLYLHKKKTSTYLENSLFG